MRLKIIFTLAIVPALAALSSDILNKFSSDCLNNFGEERYSHISFRLSTLLLQEYIKDMYLYM